MARILTAVALIAVTVVAPAPARSSDPEDQIVPRVPPGFVVSTYTHIEGLATSLAFGPDTREGAGENARRLYATNYSSGTVVAVDDVAGAGSDPAVFAEGFSSPLGVLVGKDGTVYVADSTVRKGPFGTRAYGRVWKVNDTDGDGVADRKKILLKDLPNGRHNTNGMAFGPDGKLYITNGNSTDDGVEGGDPEVKPWSGSVVRVAPKAKGLSLVELPKRKTLVAHGMRNVYDIAFSPVDGSKVAIPMNGLDDARKGESGDPGSGELENSDDLLYLTDIDDGRIDDYGFPSCLYNREKRGNLKPYDNPNPDTIKRFGTCPKRSVPRPRATFGTHVSADGLAYQVSDAWGEEYVNDLFVAEFGNLFGEEVVGHRVVLVQFDDSGTQVKSQEEFASGGTPLDLTFDAGGAMYVADFTGAIFKIDRVI